MSEGSSTTFLALNGVHTAGKSSIGERLAEEEGYRYFSEIAQDLIDNEDASWGDEGDYRFQKEIFDREVDRDQELLEEPRVEHAVVETWHPGNLAHSLETAPAIQGEAEQYLQGLVDREDVEMYSVFLDMPLERIWDRSPHFEHGDREILDFYDRVRDNHFSVYDQFDIPVRKVDSRQSLDQVYKDVRKFAEEVIP